MLKLFVVDDQHSVHLYIDKILENAELSLEIEHAENGLQALQRIRVAPPDVLLLDIEMPVMDGLALLDRLREEGISLPHIWILTAYSEFDYARKALKGGASDYLLKPIDRKELLPKLLAAAGAPAEVQDCDEVLAERIRNYIDAHYGEDISLEGIAARFYVSKYQVSRLFKRIYGENFQDYLVRVRMEAAALLLKNTTLKLYEIGNRTGFDDASYFSNAFKKYFGKSPREYRQG